MAPSSASGLRTLSTLRCCPAKLDCAPSSPSAEDRTAAGPSAPRPATTLSLAAESPCTTRSTSSGESASPGGTGRPARRARPSSSALPPYASVSTSCSSSIMASRGPGQHLHLAPRTVHAHTRPIGDRLGRDLGADDARDAILPRHDRRVTELPASVGDQRAEQRQHHVEVRRGGARDEHVALLQLVEIRG